MVFASSLDLRIPRDSEIASEKSDRPHPTVCSHLAEAVGIISLTACAHTSHTVNTRSVYKKCSTSRC